MEKEPSYFGALETQKADIIPRHNIAQRIYSSLAIQNESVLDETLDQITYCVQFGKLPTESQIRSMLECKSAFQVERKARAIKFA